MTIQLTEQIIFEKLSNLTQLSGNIVYLTGSTAFLPQPELCNEIIQLFIKSVGSSGTLIMPTFSFDFCDYGVFDQDNTGTYCGYMSSNFMKLPVAQRTWCTPIHTVAVIGKYTSTIMNLRPYTCFGSDSVFDWMSYQNTIICLFGVSIFDGMAHIHWLEEQYKVSYRIFKKFSGKVIKNGEEINFNCERFIRKKGIKLDPSLSADAFSMSEYIDIITIGYIRIRIFRLVDYINFMRRYFDANKDFLLETNGIS